jgi:isopentenyldiphosphate isomerase
MDREAHIPIVNDHDEVVGTALRSEMRRRNLTHRCTAVLVLNTKGDQILVHQRSSSKSFWPSWWDLAAGGVVEVDEVLDEAAGRELSEELGIQAKLHKLGSARYCDSSVDVFMHVWVAHHDGPFAFTDGEVAQVEWLTATQLHGLLADESRSWCRDSVAVALPLLQVCDPRWSTSGNLPAAPLPG